MAWTLPYPIGVTGAAREAVSVSAKMKMDANIVVSLHISRLHSLRHLWQQTLGCSGPGYISDRKKARGVWKIPGVPGLGSKQPHGRPARLPRALRLRQCAHDDAELALGTFAEFGGVRAGKKF